MILRGFSLVGYSSTYFQFLDSRMFFLPGGAGNLLLLSGDFVLFLCVRIIQNIDLLVNIFIKGGYWRKQARLNVSFSEFYCSTMWIASELVHLILGRSDLREDE